MNDHKTLLNKLIQFKAPITELITALRQFGWDKDELIQLQRHDIIAILKQYLQSEFTESDIEEWANALEGREDIGFEVGYEEVIREVIFELANPELIQPLSRKTAQKLVASLS